MRLTQHEFVEWVAYYTLKNETPEERQAAAFRDNPTSLAEIIRMALKAD